MSEMCKSERAWLLNSLRHQRDKAARNARRHADRCKNPKSWLKGACERLVEAYEAAAQVYADRIDEIIRMGTND